MEITINQPLAFSKLGQRTNNEDTLFPTLGKANTETSLFLVCDGMGGADKGEQASRLLCEGISEHFEANKFPILERINLDEALENVYIKYTNFIEQNPLVNRMGSTLTLLQLHNKGISIAHIGDSRVYQLRNGKIIFQTKDHKQVNELVDAEIITAEQALVHPWRNKLSRAVMAYSTNNGNGEARKKDAADITVIADIQKNDCFFLCTDGVLEQLSNDLLEKIISETDDDSNKIATLLNICESETKDNYSGYFIRVQNVLSDE